MATLPALEKSPAMATTDSDDASDLERRVMEAVMASEKRGDPPWLCVAEVVRFCGSKGTSEAGFPNADLASILVSNLCFSHNTPSMWKLLEQAMATQLVYPLHVLALLTSRVNQNRREQPEAYRLYVELMRRYAITFSLLEAGPHKEKMTTSVDDALQLSATYLVEKMDLGMAVVLFLVRAITSLVDCTLEDSGFLVLSEGQFMKEGCQSMDVDVESEMCNNRSKNKCHEEYCLLNNSQPSPNVMKLFPKNQPCFRSKVKDAEITRTTAGLHPYSNRKGDNNTGIRHKIYTVSSNQPTLELEGPLI